MIGLFSGELRRRIDSIERAALESQHQSARDRELIHSWVRYLNEKQRDSENRLATISARRPLSEEQVRTIVEKHAAFDIVLARLRTVEDRVSEIASRPAAVVDEDRLKDEISASVSEQLGERILGRVEQVASAAERTREDTIERLRKLAERVDLVESSVVERPPERVPRPDPVVRSAPESALEDALEPAHRVTARSAVHERLLKRIAKRPKDVVKSAIHSIVAKYGKILGTELRDMLVDEQRLCSKSSLYRHLAELEQEGAIEIITQGRDKLFVDLVTTKKEHGK